MGKRLDDFVRGLREPSAMFGRPPRPPADPACDDQMWFRLDGDYGPICVDVPGGPAVPLAEAAERCGWSVDPLRGLWRIVVPLARACPEGDWVPNLTPSDWMRFRLSPEGDPAPIMPGERQAGDVPLAPVLTTTDWNAQYLIDLWRHAAGEGGGGGRADGGRPPVTGGVAGEPTSPASPTPTPGLRVRVLGLSVPVLITPAKMLRLNDERKEGMADGHHRCIWIDGAVPRERRLEVLLEMAHRFWRLSVGPAADVDAEGMLFAAVAEPVVEDLAAQGGVATLMALEPTPSRAVAGKGADHGT